MTIDHRPSENPLGNYNQWSQKRWMWKFPRSGRDSDGTGPSACSSLMVSRNAEKRTRKPSPTMYAYKRDIEQCEAVDVA